MRKSVASELVYVGRSKTVAATADLSFILRVRNKTSWLLRINGSTNQIYFSVAMLSLCQHCQPYNFVYNIQTQILKLDIFQIFVLKFKNQNPNFVDFLEKICMIKIGVLFIIINFKFVIAGGSDNMGEHIKYICANC